MRLMKIILLVLAVLAFAPTAFAQQNGTINPTTLEFDVSADHDAVFLGAPLVTSYELRIFLKDAAEPFMAGIDLGKPTPASGVRVSVRNPAWFATLAVKTEYVARVVAIGPTGQGVSDPSAPFGNAGPPTAPRNTAATR